MKPEFEQNADGTLKLSKYYQMKKIKTIEDLLRVVNSFELCYKYSKIKKYNLEDLFDMSDMEFKNTEDLKNIMEIEIWKHDIINQNK